MAKLEGLPDNKDHWDKMAIILAPVGGLLTAIAVASLGFMGSAPLERQQSEEAKLRLYSELMTRREESEATLRKEMFQSIIGSFFDASTGSLDTRLLKMELLAQNFHEALSLSPLFLHLKREIETCLGDRVRAADYEVRLSELAREVTRKQIVVLEAGGKRFDWTVMLSDSLLAGQGSEQLEDVTLELDGISRRFRVTLQSVDTAQRQIHTMLEIETGAERYAVDFDVGFFDSPDDRQHPALQRPARGRGADRPQFGRRQRVSLVYFPGSRASLREKPYYEEILRKLATQ